MTVEIKLKLCARTKKERGLYYMKNLMHDITCSNIRLSELKLKRIKLYKKRLLEAKPAYFRKKKLLAWQSKLDELATSPIYETNLMSYLNSNINLIDYSLDDKTLSLNFNNSILSDNTTNKILEEVIYTIGLTAIDNFNVEEVSILVNNEEIYKNSLKSLEIG